MSSAGNVSKKPRFIKVSEIEYKIIFLENKSSALSEKEIERLNSLKEQKLMQESLGVNIRKTARIPTDWIFSEVKKTADLSVEVKKTAYLTVEVKKTVDLSLEVKKATEQSVEVKKPTELSAEVNSSSELPTEVKNTVDMAARFDSSKPKQAYSNAFLQFKSEKKKSLLLLNPAAKLNLTQIRKEWSTLTDSERAPYKKAACEERKLIGIDFRKNFLEKTRKISDEERKMLKTEAERKY